MFKRNANSNQTAVGKKHAPKRLITLPLMMKLGGKTMHLLDFQFIVYVSFATVYFYASPNSPYI